MKNRDADEPQKLARIAREYWINGKSQREIAAMKIWGEEVNQSTVAHWLRRARERGVVAIDIDADFAMAGIEHRDQSRRLRDMYDLGECLVVDVGSSKLYDDPRANELHTVVANTSGVRLREWIQSRDHIVVGGGRAPLRVARFIKRTPPARREIRISPIAGRVWTGSWQEDGPGNLQRPLDADDAARLFAFAFEHEPGTRFSQIGHPLYAESDLLARQIIEDTCVFLPGGGWNLALGIQPPVRALVGVGVVHPESGHRISELLNKIATHPDDQVAPHLRWAASKFEAAIGFTKKHGLPCVGDVANRLFPTLFLPDELEDRLPSPELFEQLANMLDELNERAVVMDWAHLRDTPSVWAVAAGQLKIQPLWTLLVCRYLERNKNQSVIKELSTDAMTAERLENALRQFERATPAVRRWYEIVAPKIFRPRPTVEKNESSIRETILVRKGGEGSSRKGSRSSR